MFPDLPCWYVCVCVDCQILGGVCSSSAAPFQNPQPLPGFCWYWGSFMHSFSYLSLLAFCAVTHALCKQYVALTLLMWILKSHFPEETQVLKSFKQVTTQFYKMLQCIIYGKIICLLQFKMFKHVSVLQQSTAAHLNSGSFYFGA